MKNTILKKLSAIVICLVLVVAMIPISVSAAVINDRNFGNIAVGDTLTVGDYLFTVTTVSSVQGRHEFELTEYTGTSTSVTVPVEVYYSPSVLNSAPIKLGNVVSIGDEAFKDNATLVSVDMTDRIPNYNFVKVNAITTIGAGAFEGCTALESVVLGPSVSTIGNRAFFGCTSLTEIEFPASVRELGVNSFNGSSSLTDVYLNEGLEKIGMGSFTNTGARNIVIPSTVTMIGVGTDGTSYGGKTFGLINTMVVHAMEAQSGSGIMETASNPTVYAYEGSNVSEWGLPSGVTVVEVKDISVATLSNSFLDEYEYDGKAHSPAEVITHNGTALVKDTHFTISYERDGNPTEDLTNAGEIVAIVEGIYTAGYMGTSKFTIVINPVGGLFIIARDKSVEDGQFATGTATDVIYWGLVEGDVIESVKLTADGDSLVPSEVVIKNGDLDVSASYSDILYVNGRSFTEKSIESFTKTTEGNVDTYTIVFGDGTTETIVITNGEDGEDGEDGATGPAGPQGEKGEKGDKGDTGAAGVDGATGSAGPQGEKGEKGDKGDTGAAGADGATGSAGPQGEKGEKGDKGDTGAAGADGSDGAGGSPTLVYVSMGIGGVSLAGMIALLVIVLKKKRI